MLFPYLFTVFLVSAPQASLLNGTWDGTLETDHANSTCAAELCDGTEKHSWGFDGGRMVYGDGHLDLKKGNNGILLGEITSREPSTSGTLVMVNRFYFQLSDGKLRAASAIKSVMLDAEGHEKFECLCVKNGYFTKR